MIVDATANRRAYRDRARVAIERFAEIYVSTPLEVCAARDTKGLYRSGNANADGAAEVMALLERRGWLKP